MDKFDFDLRRYLSDTAHLCTVEHGAYVKLILHYMATEQPLLDDDTALANIAGLSADEWSVMAPRLRKFFRAEGGRLYQKHCERTLGQRDIAKPNPKPKPKKLKQGDMLDASAGKPKRIDVAWAPSRTLREYAQKCGVDPDGTAECFRDYFLASGRSSAWKLDWDAAFRQWCRRERDSGIGPRGRPGAGGVVGARPKPNGGGYTESLLGIARRANGNVGTG